MEHIEEEGLVVHIEEEGLVVHIEEEGLVVHIEEEGLVVHIEEERLVVHIEEERLVVHIEEEGLVVHIEEEELGTAWTRVVMPKCRRQSILALAHSNPMGGHFRVKRTTARVRKHFTWPGLSVDIKSLCTSCPQCPKAARNDHSRAPLVPLPVITVPFSRLAFDVVGPLPRRGLVLSTC